MSLYQSALEMQEKNYIFVGGNGNNHKDMATGSVTSDNILLTQNDQHSQTEVENEIAADRRPTLPPRRMISREADLYFNDGERRIDYVLVYEWRDQTEAQEEARNSFHQHLVEEGLELEFENDENKKIHFVKIYASWEVMTRYAEIVRLKLPMKEPQDILLEKMNVKGFFPDLSLSERKPRVKQMMDEVQEVVVKAFDWMKLDDSIFPIKDKRFTHEFTREKEYLFDIPKNKDEFFGTINRSIVVDFILKRSVCTTHEACVVKNKGNCAGIQRLLADKVYTACYSLHESDLTPPGPDNPRATLRAEWGSLWRMHKYQPLDHIKDYLGVRMALYFAWLGFYTYMLIPAAIVGLICFIYGICTLHTFVPSQDICNKNMNITMCPSCDQKACEYWRLDETCLHSRMTYLFDNSATVVFAAFMSFWSALFLEMWKRYSASITFRWDLTGFDESDDQPRAEYLAKLSHVQRKQVNIMTNQEEPYVSYWRQKFPAVVVSFSVVLLLVSIAIAAVIGVMFYRIAVRTSLALEYGHSDNDFIQRNSALITSITAALLNLVCILLFNQVYDNVATALTKLEMPRTQTEFDDSLTLKMFLLQFVNYYSSIFYIAFFKGKILGRPGKYNKLAGYRQEECSPGGCFLELTIQLAIIMIGKQAMNTVLETCVPWITSIYKSFKIKITASKTYVPQFRWEKDYRLNQWEMGGLFWEYLEMVLQFGFVTIFAAAFPLAPIFALFNNGFEMRLDAKKILAYFRRPLPRRVKNIGIWFRILDAIGKLAVITNAFIIAFTSNYVPRLVYMFAESRDRSLNGYLNHSLAFFNVTDFPIGERHDHLEFQPADCRYEAYREPYWSNNKYKYTHYHWHVLAARLAFVVVFENIVVLVTTLVRWLVPDIPKKVKDKMCREAYIINETIVEHEFRRARESNIVVRQGKCLINKRKSKVRQKHDDGHLEAVDVESSIA